MKLLFTEESLKDILDSQVFKDAPEEIMTNKPGHIAKGMITKFNNQRVNSGCIFSINNNGLLLTFLSGDKWGKVSHNDYFKFTDIQGINIKDGKMNYKICLQLKDNGARLTFYLRKRNSKRFPNQNVNTQYIVSMLESLNINDMRNPLLKYINKGNIPFPVVAYLVLFIDIIIFCILDKFTSLGHNRSLWGSLVFSIFIIEFIPILAVFVYLDIFKDRRYRKEYESIIKKYEVSEDICIFYDDIKNIKNKPKTKSYKNIYYIMLSYAANEAGHKEEALKYVKSINYGRDKKLKAVIDKQIEDIN